MKDFNQNFQTVSIDCHNIESLQFPLIKLSVDDILRELYQIVNINNQNAENDFIDIK